MLKSCVLLLSLVTSTLAKMEGFIVGGSFANISQHAHSAFLKIHCVSDRGVKTGFICGSSIVNQYILLSAAHCIYGCTSQSHIGINLGNENRQRGQTYQAHSFAIHEDFSLKTSQNDICLLKLKYPISLHKKATRIALMEKPPYGEKATVAGWGMIDVNILNKYVCFSCISFRDKIVFRCKLRVMLPWSSLDILFSGSTPYTN